MPIRAVILDFDGVINDSASLKSGGKRIIQIVRRNGQKIPKDIYKRLKSNWGRSGVLMIKNVFGLSANIAEKIHREWEKVDVGKFFPLIHGSSKTIRKLRSHQIKVLLLTNRNKKNLMEVLLHFKLTALFDFIQARDDWAFSKPDPHAFCLALHQLAKSRIRPEECVYVGDTILDFECTTARGLISVSVLTGVFNKPDFLKAGQKKENIIRSIADLPEWIEQYDR